MGKEIPEQILPFWLRFQATTSENVSARFYEAFHFCYNEGDANDLADLVVQGTKRATASLRWIYEPENEPLPKVGDLSVVTNWAKEPICVIETTQVDVMPYNEVSKEFAEVEGEGDGSLRYWREVHWTFFSAECQQIGREPAMDMPVVCERFRVVYLEQERD